MCFLNCDIFTTQLRPFPQSLCPPKYGDQLVTGSTFAVIKRYLVLSSLKTRKSNFKVLVLFLMFLFLTRRSASNSSFHGLSCKEWLFTCRARETLESRSICALVLSRPVALCIFNWANCFAAEATVTGLNSNLTLEINDADQLSVYQLR